MWLRGWNVQNWKHEWAKFTAAQTDWFEGDRFHSSVIKHEKMR
jgi:hypothetical protein